MTCKDCVYSELCKETHRFGIADLPYDEEGAPCELFKSKADFERHAHWIEDDREATCSDCKCRTFNWAAWSFDYYPFCGAVMDGKDE